MRIIKQIVIHCSASPDGVDVSPETIDRWHEARGFNRTASALAMAPKENAALAHIGYHWIIRTNGQPVKGRSVDEVGAHVAGHNSDSVGICMVGTDRFFFRQFEALHELLGTLAYTWQDRYPLKQRVKYRPKGQLMLGLFDQMGITIVGHRDLSPDLNGDGKITPNEWLKTCPGYDVAELMRNDFIPREANCLDNDATIWSPSANERVAGTDRPV